MVVLKNVNVLMFNKLTKKVHFGLPESRQLYGCNIA